MKSDFNAALGMGMRGGCQVLFENCDFILTSGAAGAAALYAHDADSTAQVGVQNLTIRNCRIISQKASGAHAVLLQSQERTGTTVNLTMQETYTHTHSEQEAPLYTLNWYNGVSTDGKDFQGLINWRLSPDSYGNTAAVFNAR